MTKEKCKLHFWTSPLLICGDVLELFEFGPPIVLSAGNAHSCRSHVEVAMLVVATVRLEEVELEFNVDRVGGDEVVIMVSVRQDVELSKLLAPLL